MTARPRSAAPRGRGDGAALPLVLLALFAVAVGVDAFRIGFFADDYHFLDVARRVPLWRTLAGQYGIWPWVRPLSRELYFRVAVAFGPWALFAAHAMSLAAAAGAGWLTWRIGRRLVGAPAAAIAVVLVAAYDFTRFLVAWASGFQDLLALLLVLAALDAWLSGRRRRALAWALLAPFAKESGFAVFPLLVAFDLVAAGRRPDRDRFGPLAAVFSVDVALHVLARLTWHTAGGSERTTLEPARLGAVFAQALGGFVSTNVSLAPTAIAVAAASGALAVAWLLLAARAPAPAPAADAVEPRRALAFVAVAALVGLAPAVAGHLAFVSLAYAYHFFPALPWIALLAGVAIARLPRPAILLAVPLLVTLDVAGSAYRAPDLSSPDGWRFSTWQWKEAERLDAVSRRLEDDVRTELQRSAEGDTGATHATVLYEAMPYSSFFQTEDGPATREALRDTSVRAYWINDPPEDVHGDRLVILSFDPATMHLRLAHWTNATATRRATNAIVAGRASAANAFALHQLPEGSAPFDRIYIRTAAVLLAHGPSAFEDALHAAGLADTLGASPAAIAGQVARAEPGVGLALENMLRHPLAAAPHAALAESLLAHGLVPHGAMELRIAVTLDPHRFRDRMSLAACMVRMGGTAEALAELGRIADDASAGPWAEQAREAAATMRRTLPEPPADDAAPEPPGK